MGALSPKSQRASVLGERGFSLLELLVVMGVIALLLALAIPAFNSIGGGNNLARAGNQLGDALALARQLAMAQNRDVAVRLITSPTDFYIDRFQIVAPGASAVDDDILSRIETLPIKVMVSSAASISPLVSSAETGITTLPGGGTVSHYQIRFNAEGMLASSGAFLTLHAPTDADKVPSSSVAAFDANFYTIQINPITGSLAIHRP